MTAAASPYLDISAGGFSVAVRTIAVTAVVQDLHLDDGADGLARFVTVRDQKLPFGDLLDLFAERLDQAPSRGHLPFVVTVDDGVQQVAIGADRVSHIRSEGARLAVPRFGLLVPDLFEGAIRESGRLLLVLSPAAICRLISRTAVPDNE